MIRGMTMMLAAGLALASAGDARAQTDGPPTLRPRVKIATTLGDITIELDAEKAPVTVLNFLRYAEEKYYDGTVFHRVISNFMIQGGGFTQAMNKKDAGLHAPIKNEWRNGLKNARGTIAMARLGNQPDSATAQFFINVTENASLDQARDGAAYAVFGKVVEGMEAVEAIRTTKVILHPNYPSGSPVTPETAVVIQSVTLLDTFDKAKAEELAKLADEKAAEAERAAEAAARATEEAKMREVPDFVAKTEAELGMKVTTTASGLMYFILREGTGPSPTAADTVEVHYHGTYLNGETFDSSYDRNVSSTFPLSGVIRGWTEGVALMKTGAKWKFVIPSDLAYGPGGRGSIPPNETLVFDIELLGIK